MLLGARAFHVLLEYIHFYEQEVVQYLGGVFLPILSVVAAQVELSSSEPRMGENP